MHRRNDQHKLKPHHHPLPLKPPEIAAAHHLPPPPQNCRRCESSNTKFCYYNNYSLSQPRYFCKACRRYWTHGGTLRNVPIGGGSRKTKRPKPSRTQPPSPNLMEQPRPLPPVMTSMGNPFYTGGSFLSSLASMQSLSAGISQGAALNLGSVQYETNMVPPPQQFNYFPSSIPPSLTSWTQNFIPATSAPSTSFWSGSAAADGGNHDQAGSSFNPNQWQDGSNQGFDSSSQP